MWNLKSNTVKLDFKNRQDKNQLDFKNQITNDKLDQVSSKNSQDKNKLGFKNLITNDHLDQISFKNHQDKNNLTLRTKIVVTKNVLKVKFDCAFHIFFKNCYSLLLIVNLEFY